MPKNNKKERISAMGESVKKDFVSEIENESLRLLETVSSTEREVAEIYPRMVDDPNSDEMIKMDESLKRATSNMAKAQVETFRISDEFHARLYDIRKQQKKRRFNIPSPANAVVDLSESMSDSFAKGLNIYKILLIGFVGSFAGVVIELLWCLVTNGYIESRSGLVYGPFNLLYGAGAVLLTVFLYKFRNRGASISFIGGMIVGSALEYVCSWGQEALFGTRSWDYSHMPFNLNGRICLLYSFFWGFLGVLWIKRIYPIMAKWILKIPNKIGKIVTWALLVFFIFNAFMTLAALTRWVRRTDGIEPKSAFGEFIDERFTDERMERIFANMEFSE